MIWRWSVFDPLDRRVYYVLQFLTRTSIVMSMGPGNWNVFQELLADLKNEDMPYVDSP